MGWADAEPLKPEMSRTASTSYRALSWLLVFLFISAAYLYTFPQPNVFYAGIVLLHVLAGIAATVLMVPVLWRFLRNGSIASCLGWVLVLAGAVLGLVLIKTGTPRAEWNWLYLHIVVSLAGVGILFAEWAGKRGWLAAGPSSAIVRPAICLVLLAGLGAGARYVRESRWQSRARIENPLMPPTSMMGAVTSSVSAV